jgi:thymidylate synthase
MTLATKPDLFMFEAGDFTLSGYEPHPHIKAAVAI